ncbi:MAG: DUF7065 domain-containing protein [Promethearchaeota archaeon]
MEPLTHPQLRSNHPEWNESYYFVFYSKEHKLGGMSRLGFKPNKPEGMAFFFLFLPDGSGGGYFQLNKTKKYSNPLSVGKIIHENIDDGYWKYHFKGKMIFVKNSEDLPRVREEPSLIGAMKSVKMDLEFKAINETYEYSEYMNPESLEVGKKAGDKHWEQIAEVNGVIEIDNKKYLINNELGQRDHTFGVRDWTEVGAWFYYVIWFDKNLAINPAAVITEDGRMSTGGFLYKDGKNIPLKEIRILKQEFRADGIFPISSELEIIDFEDEKYSLEARAGSTIPVPFKDEKGNESILIQSFGKFKLDENTGGYGTFETLRRVK